MARVIRLVTFVEVDDSGYDPRRLSVSARLDAVLSDGVRVMLLDDRGWSESGPPDVWERTSVEEIEGTARAVVGPDEASENDVQQDLDSSHWRALAVTLRRHDVDVDAADLERVRHDVVLGRQLRARLGGRPHAGSEKSG